MTICELVDVVKTTREASKKEKEAIRNFHEDVVEEHGLLDKDEFWPELDRLVRIVKRFRDGYGRTNWPEQSADEFFREAIFQNVSYQNASYQNALYKKALIKCLRFVATYKDKVSKVARALDRLEKDGTHDFGTGDSFMDMCDSFLLHGREAFEALMEDGVIPKKPALGENYIEMRLDEAGEDWVRNCVVYLED